jgi:mRNA interferase MazF
MSRGDIWTVSGGGDYVGKARPAVIIQDDSFEAIGSVTVCAFTTQAAEAPLLRLPVEPTEQNGLRAPCQLMVDKITSVSRAKLGTHIGRLDQDDILRLNRALLVFLGLAVPPRRGRRAG